jgi:hypothetical protein
MRAELHPPVGDKSWSLHFFDVSLKELDRAEIIYWSLHFGRFFCVNPFIQGNQADWIMVEYYSDLEGYVLEAATRTCDYLKIDDIEIK